MSSGTPFIHACKLSRSSVFLWSIPYHTNDLNMPMLSTVQLIVPDSISIPFPSSFFWSITIAAISHVTSCSLNLFCRGQVEKRRLVNLTWPVLTCPDLVFTTCYFPAVGIPKRLASLQSDFGPMDPASQAAFNVRCEICSRYHLSTLSGTYCGKGWCCGCVRRGQESNRDSQPWRRPHRFLSFKTNIQSFVIPGKEVNCHLN